MRAIREEMGFSLRDLAAVMKMPYRTLQNYEGGQRNIPQEFSKALKAEQAKTAQIRAEVYAGIAADIARSYPHGIRSAAEPE